MLFVAQNSSCGLEAIKSASLNYKDVCNSILDYGRGSITLLKERGMIKEEYVNGQTTHDNQNFYKIKTAENFHQAITNNVHTDLMSYDIYFGLSEGRHY